MRLECLYCREALPASLRPVGVCAECAACLDDASSAVGRELRRGAMLAALTAQEKGAQVRKRAWRVERLAAKVGLVEGARAG